LRIYLSSIAKSLVVRRLGGQLHSFELEKTNNSARVRANRLGFHMDNGDHSAEMVRFGLFEANLKTGELRKSGVRVPLQGQPFQVCAILLSRSGELVTREELRQKIWPEDTFVDFDHALNTAVTKIRLALGDDADNPRFVETLPRRGYRFIAPVDKPSAPVPAPTPPTEGSQGLSGNARWLALGATVLALLFGIGIWRFARSHIEGSPLSIEVVPLVGLNDLEFKPAFSPDGNQVAFSIGGPEKPGIYTTVAGGEKSLRLTSNSGDCCPRWSPDGRQVAFFRTSHEGVGIYVIPAFGGTEHRVYSGPAGFFHRALDWSPDGRVLAFTENGTDKARSWIALLSLADFSTRPLTSPPSQSFDYGPAFSPDGSTVAFGRGSVAGVVSDLYVTSAAGGTPKRLTHDNTWLYPPPTWTPDGQDIVFSSTRGGLFRLWRISASGGEPWPAAGAGVNAISPSISPKGNQLVYQQVRDDARSIWRLELKDEKHRQGQPVQVVSERGWKGRPHFSPDGKRIVFESWRSGYMEIRACDSDGQNCAQLTSLRGVAGAARWSPDGRYIAFEFRPEEHSEIYLLKVDGSMVRLLTTFPGANNGGPNWSRDGKWIYFYSDRGGGPFQIWKIQLDGGVPVQVTRNGGVFETESADGRFLYYSKLGVPGIWKMPMRGGEETRVLDEPNREFTIVSGGAFIAWWDWVLAQNGIYFLHFESYSNGTLEYFDFDTREITPIWTLTKPPGYGLSLSPDGKSILYVQNEIQQSNIMLVKNFR
jgi:Tol biopolymer transport system component/DNA-binding winged helix-turn-helix (wHTH) protein